MSLKSSIRPFLALVLLSGPLNLAAGEWPWTRWTVDCIDPDPCAPADEIYKDLLEHASVWLDGLGFGPPRVQKRERRESDAPGAHRSMHYLAEVSDKKNSDDTESIGVYFPTDDELYLRSDVYFAMGDEGETHETPDYRVEKSNTFTPVHELFHAVQNNYHDISESGRDWIWEGMADAVLRAYADEFESELRVGMKPRGSFDHPLHKPPDEDDAYRTWFFWRNVGRAINSPSTIGYFQDVFGEDLDTNNGLDGVDRALGKHGGLYKRLPDFFSGLDIQKGYFGPVDEIQATLPPDKTEHEEKFGSTVKEVAGTAFHLRVKPRSTGAGKPLKVEISLAEDHEDLHLIVDGRRYDGAASPNRNFFRDEAVDRVGAEYDIVVANIAQTASKSVSRNIMLKVKLREQGSGWVRLNGEEFEINRGICNAAGVVVQPVEHSRGVFFTIYAPRGSTRVAWGEAGVNASIYSGECDPLDGRRCRPLGAWDAGGPRTPGAKITDFNVNMNYDPEIGVWTGAGTLSSKRDGRAAIEFLIPCAPLNRK